MCNITKYTEIAFIEAIPENLISVDLNDGFKEIYPLKDENSDIIGDTNDKNIVEPNPEIKVDVNMEIEKAEQISADSGSSPWKLDPVYVAQVFISLQLSPDGIVGDYPIDYDELEISENDGTNAVITVNSEKTDIRNIYLSRLIRQDNTGIWTVTGYDK